METTIDNRGSSAPIVMMLLVVLALLIGLMFSAVGDIPLTNHAKTGHVGEAFTAEKIQQDMAAGKCTPRGYMCKKLDTRILYCTDHPELAPGRAIGLVIGATVEQVLTGFEGSVGYWQNRCN